MPSVDELYEADQHARTTLLAARLAGSFDPTALNSHGHRLSYTAALPLSPPTALPLRDFSHLKWAFQMISSNAGRMELTGPADDLAEYKELCRLGFQPSIRGRSSYASAFFATYHEACRWARENGHWNRPIFWLARSPEGPFKLMDDHDIKVLRDRIRATSEVGPIRSRLLTRGYDIPAVRCIQRVARRYLARCKQEITVAELDSLITQAAIRLQRTVRCYLFRAHIGRRPPASIAAPVLSDPLNDASSQADTAPPKPVTVDWTQEVLADTDDAASAASTLDITALLLGLLLGPWTTRRRRNPRRSSLCRHVHTSTAYRPETLVPNDTATFYLRPHCRPPQHLYRSSNSPKPRLRLSIDHGCTDGTGPRPSFEPK